MDKKTELDARRFKLIQTVLDMEDEFMIEDLELFFARQKRNSFQTTNIPSTTGNEDINNIVDQVLEDNRSELPTNGDDFFENDLKEYMEAASRPPKDKKK